MRQPHTSKTIEHHSIWQDKPVLRVLYNDYRNRLQENLVDGPTLEIGAGSGNLKSLLAGSLAIDIQKLPWLDAVADAHRLPFRDNYFSNIVMIDVLHHLESPYLFFQEASRVLTPGGRLALIEPAITPVSWIIYHFFHPEPVLISEDPLANRTLSKDRDPFDSNQAIPTVLFGARRKQFLTTFPEFKTLGNSKFAIASYLLSGGFQPWTLLPRRLAPLLLRLERYLDKVLGGLAAFRMIVLIEKSS